MRPASEIHSALDLVEHELARHEASDDLSTAMQTLQETLAWATGRYDPETPQAVLPAVDIHDVLDELERHLLACPRDAKARIMRDALAWVTGRRPPDDGPTLWLVAYLLDDPPKPDTPPEVN